MKINSNEIQEELFRILSYWKDNTIDSLKGGFIGQIDAHGKTYPEADKAVILNTRILWSFSAAARNFSDSNYEKIADRAYAYILSHFIDEQNGGVYWMLDANGQAIEPKKQIYAQAFAIYALSEYYQLTQKEEALEKAIDIFELVEQHSYDDQEDGYFEAFNREWELLDDLRLSDKELNVAKTMNTHLHVLEAYTNLYRVWKNDVLKSRLQSLTQIFLEKFIHPETNHLILFFDKNWNPKSEEISFGHDIEAAWLLCEAAEVLEDEILLKKTEQAAIRIADITLSEGIDEDGGLFNELHADGEFDNDKHWWPQAEAMVAFLNTWEISGDERYLNAANDSWFFIKNNLLDTVNGEWFWKVTKDGQVLYSEDKVGPWKAPYHNTRACLEVIRRMDTKKLQ
ncbi:MAG: N-acyl-D-glucosamine 2-epimerase [Bacteroidetes bacterium]|nr:N-acyl-D-glucosamine 2-epimerase [Bacteroidota bacterium]